MNEEQAKALRAPFDENEIGKLPRITCGECRKAQGKVCQKHQKGKCAACNNFITSAHMHLDYLGHAELTDRLLAVDPEWSWEPTGWDPDGFPSVRSHAGNLVMWGRLTICGTTRLGVGTAPAGKEDVHKELIGDFLRNAGMRFGIALDLWRKSERHEAEADAEAEHDRAVTAPPPEKATKEQRDEVKAALEKLHPDDQATLKAWWAGHDFGSLRDGSLRADAVDPILDEIAALAGEREHTASDDVVGPSSGDGPGEGDTSPGLPLGENA